MTNTSKSLPPSSIVSIHTYPERKQEEDFHINGCFLENKKTFFSENYIPFTLFMKYHYIKNV